MSYSTDDILSVFAHLGSSSNGLTQQEAQQRLKRGGKNRLNPEIKVSFGFKIIAQLLDPMLSLLLALSAISAVFVIIDGEYPYEFLAVSGIIIINAIIVVLQRQKSDRILHDLQERTAKKSSVLRSGVKTEINSEDIVVGDVIFLEAGAVVPADARVFECSELKVEESCIRESKAFPINKYKTQIFGVSDNELYVSDRNNMVYNGSTVISGSGLAVVTATGLSTYLGKTYDIVSTARKNKTPLQLKLHDANNWLNIIAMVVCGIVLLGQFIMIKINGGSLGFMSSIDSIMVALALSITAMPQGLASYAGIILSHEAAQLYAKRVVITSIPAMELLGSAQTLIYDLTRTQERDKYFAQDTHSAVSMCSDAGIIPVFISETPYEKAKRIAFDSKLTEHEEQIITGEKLEKMTDDEFNDKFMKIRLYLSITPEQKAKIVSAWKTHGYITAVTGGGTDDALALKSADVSIATDIKSEEVHTTPADAVVYDSHISKLMYAIGESRSIYSNVQKFFVFTVGSNFAELLTILLATLLNFNILGTVHILWINLITDTFPSLALCFDKSEHDLMKRNPVNTGSNIYSHGIWQDIVCQGLSVTLLTMISYFIGEVFKTGVWKFAWVTDENGTIGTTMAFLTMALCELLSALCLRSRKLSLSETEKRGNRNIDMYVSLIIALLMTTATVLVKPIAEVFGFARITFLQYTVSVLIAALMVPIKELWKYALSHGLAQFFASGGKLKKTKQASENT